jgi:hypothetical protein
LVCARESLARGRGKSQGHPRFAPRLDDRLSRRSIAVIGLLAGIIAASAALVLVGASSLCGLDENRTPTGYCAANETVRSLLVALPVLTVIVGYARSLRACRLTPIGVAAICAIAEGIIALTAGY